MKVYCNKCHSKIINKVCDCGVWFDTTDSQPWQHVYLEEILIYYAEKGNWSKSHIFTGNHHNGMCFAIFKGDYEDTQKVKKFIEELKKEKENERNRE